MLLLIATLMSSAVPRERSETATAPPRATVVRAAPEVTGELPADRIVRARLGDVVRLEVSSDSPDVAELADLGISADVAPGLPVELELVADRSGRFAVTLRDSGRRLGVLAVAP